MSTTNGAPKKLRPAKELSLPPEVEGSIKGETLLHISGLKPADGPLESQTLQVAPKPFAPFSNLGECISIIQNAARCKLLDYTFTFSTTVSACTCNICCQQCWEGDAWPQIRLQWWGDTGAGTLLQLNSGAGTIAARFPIRCSAG